jgi:hypothetical protein
MTESSDVIELTETELDIVSGRILEHVVQLWNAGTSPNLSELSVTKGSDKPSS